MSCYRYKKGGIGADGRRYEGAGFKLAMQNWCVLVSGDIWGRSGRYMGKGVG